MTLIDRKTKLTTDLDHARAQANVWAQTVIGLTAQLLLIDDLLQPSTSNFEAEAIEVPSPI